MGEFFKGWRRKTGLATLLIACVLLAPWVRTWPASEGYLLHIEFRPSKIDFSFERTDHVESGYTHFPLVRCSVQYSWIIIPLTVLSAWLLLRKPRLAKSEPEKLSIDRGSEACIEPTLTLTPDPDSRLDPRSNDVHHHGR